MDSALSKLCKSIFEAQGSAACEELNELEKNGLVKRFEFTIELCWNVLKDYLQEQGVEFQLTPKGTFRQAQQSGLINVGQELIDALEIRNMLAHDYDSEKFDAAERKIRKECFPAIEKVYLFFTDLMAHQTKLF